MNRLPLAAALAVVSLAGFAFAGPPKPPSAAVPAPLSKTVLEVERIVVHIAQNAFGPNADRGGPLGDFTRSVEKKEFAASAPEAKALAALVASGDLTNVRSPPKKCAFNANLAVEWIKGSDRVYAVFCFGCVEVTGNAGVQGFKLQPVAKWSSGIFPNHEPSKRAAAGQDPRGEED